MSERSPAQVEDTVPGPAPERVVDDVDVFIDGHGAHTLVMVHGWPDTPALWDASVASLAAAALLYYTVERPGLRLGVRWRTKRLQRRPAPAH